MAYVAILMVTETKTDESFAAGQFIKKNKVKLVKVKLTSPPMSEAR